MPSRSKSRSTSRNNKTHKKLHRRHLNRNTHKKTNKNTKNKSRHNNRRNQRGGFNSCSLATVQEPGFSIPAIGNVPGFSLSDSKGAIFRPNCKSDTYQAMTPS